MNAIRIYRQRMREDGDSPRGSFWYQSPFRSNHEGFAYHWGWLVGFFPAMIVMDLLDWPLVVSILVAILIIALFYLGWFAWVVWGRDAFPLPDRDQQPSDQQAST